MNDLSWLLDTLQQWPIPSAFTLRSPGDICLRFLRTEAKRRTGVSRLRALRRHRRADLSTVGFRNPDPFRRKKAVLYAVDLGCASPHCENNAKVYPVAAITESVASLLDVWKRWVIHLRCPGHALRLSSRGHRGCPESAGPG